MFIIIMYIIIILKCNLFIQNILFIYLIINIY